MLSTENSPPDPPCLCEISQLKSSSGDERASDINQLQCEVDLLKFGLGDNNPLPKFSIRDYAFSTRGKDIKTNWPFSPKNLQLCLKHGVRDVLPPFQSLDFVRNQSGVKCTTHNTSNSDEKLSSLSDHLLSVSSDNVYRKLVVDIKNINSSGSDEEKEFPSTTTSQSYSDINSVSPLRSIYLVREAQNFPGKAEENIESAVPASNKAESSIQNPVKKCRLIVKLSNIAVLTSNEDSVVNTSVVSETMASKVCPVCKTFLSSSNTTLNAHIDQCLSGESTIKWTSNSKVIKHRIKPRKTRLMVDIYASALHCTLEDLDRRNGTNWASNSGFRAQDFETSAEAKNETYSSVNIVNKKEEGSVYIDSNGTKLRILSKINDLPSSSNGDYGPSNLLKKDKGSKFLACKKKNNLVHKLKLLKCSYGQRSCSHRINHCFEDNEGQQRKFTTEEGCKKEDLTQSLKAYDQMKSNDLGMTKHWVGSKRSGFKKKINLENENWYPDKIMTKLGVKSSLSSSNDRLMKRTSDLHSPVLSDEDRLLPTQGIRIKESLSCNSQDEYKELLSLRKRVGFSLLESRDCHDKRNHMVLTKCNVKQPRKDSSSVHELYMNPSNCMECLVSARSNKRMELNISPAKNADDDCCAITPRLSHHHALPSGGKKCSYMRKASLNQASSRGKFSLLKKNLLSPRHASVPESVKNLGGKCLKLKKRRLHYTSESDEGAPVLQSATCRQDNLVVKLGENAAQMEKASVKSYIKRTRVLKIQKIRGKFVNSGKEGAMASKGSEASSESDRHGAGKNFDSFIGGDITPVIYNVLDAVQGAEIPEEFVYERTSNIAGGAFMGCSKSLGSAFPALAGPFDVECISQHCIKGLEEHCPTERILGGEQKMFYADKFGKDMVIHNFDAVTEMDNNEGNYFVDVDPIPIPGPPGSFLPSPGHLGSDDLLGNSSLTTCRIQSSEEEHELVDMDSSDSPVSITSMVSISNAARSDSVSFELRSNDVQHETGHEKSGAKIDPAVESSTPFETTASGEGNLKLDESRANLMFPETSPGRFKNSQPCCCFRKEGVSLSVSLNSQESLHFRQQNTASRPLLAPAKEMCGDPMKKPNSFNSRSETLPVNGPSPESKKSIVNSPMGYAPVLVAHNSEAKFPTCHDCESSSPSTSNPVLRLMGKNLLVVNKDEDVSPQTMSTQSSIINDYPGVQSCINNSGSVDKIQNEDYSFHHFRTPCLSSQPSTVVLSSKSFGRSFTSSLERRECIGGCNLIPEQLGSKIRLDTPMTCDIDQKVRTSVPQLRTADFSSSNNEEIIDSDDSHESEASLAVEATRGELNMEAGGSMVGISASVVLGHDSRHVNSFYSNQKGGYNGSRVVPNANILVPIFKGMNANPVKWNCTSEGSSVLHSNSLTALSPSAGHWGSPLYFPPSFS